MGTKAVPQRHTEPPAPPWPCSGLAAPSDVHSMRTAAITVPTPPSPKPILPVLQGSHLRGKQELVGWTFCCAPQKYTSSGLHGTEGAGYQEQPTPRSLHPLHRRQALPQGMNAFLEPAGLSGPERGGGVHHPGTGSHRAPEATGRPTPLPAPCVAPPGVAGAAQTGCSSPARQPWLQLPPVSRSCSPPAAQMCTLP